jgi:hypothetical protein
MDDRLMRRENQNLVTANDASAVVDMTKRVREILESVMKENVHYGKIPGTPKNSLYLPGAEKLGLTFNLAPSYEVEDVSGLDNVRYRVVCTLTSRVTGAPVAQGIGEASSDEEKYRWKKPTCDEEWEEAPESRRREKWKNAGPSRKPYKVKQIRTEHADIANTVLQMARKRGYVNAMRTAVAASDVFDNDLGDLTEKGLELEDQATIQQPKATPPPPRKQPPARRPAPPPPADDDPGPEPDPFPEELEEPVQAELMPEASAIPEETWDDIKSKWHERRLVSEPQVKRLFAIARKNGWDASDVKREVAANLGTEVDDLPAFECYDAIVAAFEGHGPK